MTTLQNGDSFLVQRTDSQSGISTNYQVSQENLMANLADDDLLLVQRTSAGISTNYSITGSALKEDLTGVTGLIANPVEVLTPLDGSGLSGDISYYPETSAVTTVEAVSLGGVVEVESNTWGAITYNVPDTGAYAGSGLFVAVADNNSTNTVMLSSDGINWTPEPDPMNSANHEWRSITSGVATSGVSSGEMTYVAVSQSGNYRIMYSVSGGSWSLATAPELSGWHSVTYGDGKFVAVAYHGTKRVMHSTDGYTWTLATAAEQNNWLSVCYGNGKFVAVANTGTNRVMYSTNGINWYAASAPEQNGWKSITYADGKFVAVAFDGTNRVMYSSDGINWSSASAAEDNSWYSVTYGDGKFVAVSYDGINRVMWSTDGINWTAAAAAENNRWKSVKYGGDKFVAVSDDGTNRVMYSYDGISWDGDFTKLTLTNDKVFDSSNGTEMSTVDQVLTAGTVVDGTGGSIGPKSAFSVTTYTGNSGDQTITTGIDNTGKSLIWIKNRSENFDHLLTVNQNKWLSSNNTNQAYDLTSQVTAFNSDGFSVSSNTVTNDNNRNYVAWNFRALPGFFDVVTYNGNGSVQEIPHGLDAEVGFLIAKQTNASRQWFCWHKTYSANKNINLDSSASVQISDVFWNNTKPTSTHFTVGASAAANNNGGEYVAYLFADTPGLIKCGSYTGSGAGTTVDCGFKPGWVLIKQSTGSGNSWRIYDNQRGDTNQLYADHNYGEDTGNNVVTFTNTGFTLGSGNNVNSWEYIYVAIAENATVNVPAPTGTLTADANPSDPSITLTDVTGTWESGMTAVGRTQLTEYAPGPEDITFTSTNAGTTPFNGTDATLAFRRWTLESRASAGDPWIVVDTYEDYDIVASQDGATPWSSNKPTLAPNTMYRVKVAYISTNADPVESVYNTFTTGSN